MGQSFSTNKGSTLQSDASQPNTETSFDRSTSSQVDFPKNNINQNISSIDDIVHHSNLIQQNQRTNFDEPFNPKELQIISDSNNSLQVSVPSSSLSNKNPLNSEPINTLNYSPQIPIPSNSSSTFIPHSSRPIYSSSNSPQICVHRN